MRYALVSDIHANLQAWKAVLIDIRSLGADQIICLGDIVGYGPNPCEVLQSVHSNVDHIILGNHDAVACDKMGSSEFYHDAQKIIEWTKSQLNDKAKAFLRALPLTLAGESFRCAHGDFSDPGAFNYILEPSEALASWHAVPDQLLFVGHTHEPTIHVIGQSGTPHLIRPRDFQVEPEKRYIVNVGSVGQPRDTDARSCYCIYDTSQSLVMWRRVPFDIDAFRRSIQKANISEKPSFFLHQDPRKDMPPVRDLVNFAPAVSHDKSVKDTVEVQQLKMMKRRVRKWKLTAALIAALTFSSITYAGLSFWKYKNRSTVIGDPLLTSIHSASFAVNTNMLITPSISSKTGTGIEGWNIKLGDKQKHSIHFDAGHQEGQVFVFSSKNSKDEISLISPQIVTGPCKKMCFEAVFKKMPSFSGNIVAAISVLRKNHGKDEMIDPFVLKAPNQIRQGNWVMARQTFELPANASSMRIQIRGRFTGEVVVKDVSLENRN